jgi:hypothetical protein
MTQIQATRKGRRPASADLDLRTPTGRTLPY